MNPKRAPGGTRAYVTGVGVLCAGAANVPELRRLLAFPRRSFGLPTAFPAKGPAAQLPVAEVDGLDDAAGGLADPAFSGLPRTHRMALRAAKEAIGDGPLPDAIVVGTTTGGILTTEAALQAGATDPRVYRFHGLDTVAQTLAQAFSVAGPVLTVSTACSSAAVAVSVAQALLRAGLARRVLAGGADSLSRLTFHGFRQLQLIAPDGCKPLDANRSGMTVGEGAGFLLLECQPPMGRRVLAEVLGTGLSCDAYHATSPHPEGAGAVLAMRRALADAGIEPASVSYVSLHGTGTPDNDAAEARALKQVFGTSLPASSSIKGLTGHTLAAAGGIEAVVSVIAIDEDLLPANTGIETVDPALGVSPVVEPMRARVETVLSNSFGFGGNNASLILAKPSGGSIMEPVEAVQVGPTSLPALRIASVACLSGRGDLDETLLALAAGQTAIGLVPDAAFAKAAPPAFVRRLRRLPRLLLALASAAQAQADTRTAPDFLAVGTAWGPLAETWEFLRKLFESNDQFSSPMDFIGSVNNAPAGQVALLLGARAPNLTFSSGEDSFAQAVLSASLAIAAGADNALVLAAEAYQQKLSPLLDADAASTPCDGGAGFVLLPDAPDGHDGPDGSGASGQSEQSEQSNDERPTVRIRWLGERRCEPSDVSPASLLAALDGMASIGDRARFDAVALGISAGHAQASRALASQVASAFPGCAVLPYHHRLGQHASVSATAAALTARGLGAGMLPFADLALPRGRVLLLQLGHRCTALEVFT
jgi:3-oxoacyl-(acyl-carrier-protein) synthase